MKHQDELDFENYSVETEKAGSIREKVAQLKNSTWIKDFKYLVQELGNTEQDSQVDAGLFAADAKGQDIKVFRMNLSLKDVGEESLEKTVEFKITQSQSELKAFYGSDTLVEVAFLPKEDDYLLYSFRTDVWTTFETNGKEQLQELIKAAHSAKQKKQEAFKAKFSKTDA